MEAGQETGFGSTVVRFFSEPLQLVAELAREALSLIDPVVYVLLIILGARIAVGVVNRLITRVELPDRIGRLEIDPKQIVTARQFLRSALAYAIYVAAILWILATFGFDPSPFLVGATGLVAIAIGFGSQGLVQDVVTGIFILAERQYSVGDFVEVGPHSGFVEDVGIRVTRIRDVNGALRLIPNRTVLHVGNYPKGYMEAIVDIFLEDAGHLDRAQALVEAAGRRLDEELDVILLPPRLSRPLPGGSPPFLRAVVRFLPGQQWAIDREFVGRAKVVLQGAGIPLGPAGARVVYQCDRVAFYNNLNRIKTRWSEGS
jgi:small conductance mechanosensitive channel